MLKAKISQAKLTKLNYKDVLLRKPKQTRLIHWRRKTLMTLWALTVFSQPCQALSNLQGLRPIKPIPWNFAFWTTPQLLNDSTYYPRKRPISKFDTIRKVCCLLVWLRTYIFNSHLLQISILIIMTRLESTVKVIRFWYRSMHFQ